MSVFIPIPIAEITEEAEQPSRTYRLDIPQGRIFRVGSCDGLEAVNQYIRKALISPRFKCLIYDRQYGSELKQAIIGADVTSAYVDTALPELVKEACLVDSRVLDVYDFSIDYKNDEARIRFKAKTIFGDTAIDEVI